MVRPDGGGHQGRHRGPRPSEGTNSKTYLKKTFPGTDTFVKLLEVGPPVGRPVQYRVSGPDIRKVKEFSQELAGIVRSNPHLGNVVFDWMEPARVVKVDVLQDKARQLGVSSEDIATTLNSVLDGTSITQVRDSIYLVNVVGRATGPERASIDTLRDLQLVGLGGQSVPLGAVARLRYEIEQPTIWRRSRLPTITLKASIADSVQPKTVVDQLAPKVAEFTKAAARGIFGGDGRCGRRERQEPSSDRGGRSSDALHHGDNPDGAVAELSPAVPGVRRRAARGDRRRHGPAAERSASGFVAILGVLALIGILIRNSVILIVQIEELKKAGRPAWEAVVEATEHRMRPIMLTAAAASLGLLPIAREIFWGPMAYAMMGGIIVGTVLTLLFLPALYVAWFRIKEERDHAPSDSRELVQELSLPQRKSSLRAAQACAFEKSLHGGFDDAMPIREKHYG